MKTGIHPEVKDTKVHCNGCGTNFVTHATVDSITVEICSNCHPFYTGKQKLVDTAGRVEKFQARAKVAAKLKAEEAKRTNKKAVSDDISPEAKAEVAVKVDPKEEAEIKHIAEELKDETVDLPAEEIKTDSDSPKTES